MAVISDPKFDHFTRHPRGDESLLLAEIADSTSPLDLTVKTTLYARALVPEYWVVDLPACTCIDIRPEAGTDRSSLFRRTVLSRRTRARTLS